MDQWVGATRGTDLELVVEPDSGCQAPEDARGSRFRSPRPFSMIAPDDGTS